jgi:hypothetical protein
MYVPPTLVDKNTLRVFLVIILMTLAGIYIHTNNQEDFYQKHALPEVTQILLEISDWKEESLSRRLSDETKRSINPAQMTTLLAQYRPLGQFLAVRHLEFSKLMGAMNVFGENRISYQGIVEFESGDSDITITLLEEGGVYQIYNLNIKLETK